MKEHCTFNGVHLHAGIRGTALILISNMATSAQASGISAISSASGGTSKTDNRTSITRGMLRLYTRLEDEVLSVIDADEVGIDANRFQQEMYSHTPVKH